MNFLFFILLVSPPWVLFYYGWYRWRQSLPKDSPERAWLYSMFHYQWLKPAEFWVPYPVILVVTIGWGFILLLPILLIARI